MATFRKVHVTFWNDSFVESLLPMQKFLFLYLLTNARTTQCGIYEITPRQIAYDTGIAQEEVINQLQFFQKSDKIRFSASTNEIALKNWNKYNSSASVTVKSCVDAELKKVKDRVLIQYVYSIDTSPNLVGQEKNKNKNKNKKEESPSSDGDVAGATPQDDPLENKKPDKKQLYELLITKPKDLEPYVDFWNLFAKEKGKPSIQKLTDSRKRQLRTRINDPDFNLPEILRKAKDSDFLMSEKWFGFDWIIKNGGNFLKILEGNYDNSPKKAMQPARTSSSELTAVERYQHQLLHEALNRPEYQNGKENTELAATGSEN